MRTAEEAKTRKIDLVPTRVDGPAATAALEEELIDEICALVDQRFLFHERE